MAEGWLSSAEAGELLGVSERTVQRWLKGEPIGRTTAVPQIPVYRDEYGRARYRRADVVQWMQEHPDGIVRFGAAKRRK